MAMKVRQDDMVKVILGKDRGKTGRVLQVAPRRERVYVEGIAIRKRHIRPRTAQEQGGVVESPGPVHVSNVMLIDPKSDEPTRVGVRREDGQRKRIAKRSGEEIDG